MTQGYGPDNGQQPQWGQPEQNGQQQPPQWGQPAQGGPYQTPPPAQSPSQWGQPSPAPAADPWGQPSAQPAAGPGYPGAAQSGYPGATGAAPQFTTGDGVNWSRVRLLGMGLLIGVALLLLIRLGATLAQFLLAPALAEGGEDPGSLAIGTSVVTLLLWLANLLVSLVAMVLAIMAAVMGRAKARVGGIVVAVAIPVAVVVFWILSVVLGIVAGAAGMFDPMTATFTVGGYRLITGIDAVRMLIMVAIMGIGAYLVFSTAKKKLSA
ncbi:hypothetical protein [Brachybacterium sp. FME24]|uniref:hypothetical protein n=1 Tax=Brachybacterium sp. FME24 TaxID=2742605 RepID=UPI001867BEFC|nr:hypothetical protein [Brachybacterium sp. FME24]